MLRMHWILLGLILFVGAAQSQEPAPTKEEGKTTAKQSGEKQIGTATRPFVVTVRPAEENEKEAKASNEERQNKKQSEADVVWWTKVLGILAGMQFLALLLHAGIFLYQSKRQKETVKTMRDEFTATHRPWISPEIKLASPLTYGDDGWHIAVEYCIRNVGNGPATNTDVWVQVIPSVNSWSVDSLKGRSIAEMPTLGTDTATELSNLCNTAMASGKSKVGFGRTIFPGGEARGTLHTHGSRALFTRAKELENYCGQFHVIFCVGYGFTFDESQHVTAKAFVVYKRDSGNIDLSGESVALSNLSFVPAPDTKTDYAT